MAIFEKSLNVLGGYKRVVVVVVVVVVSHEIFGPFQNKDPNETRVSGPRTQKRRPCRPSARVSLNKNLYLR